MTSGAAHDGAGLCRDKQQGFSLFFFSSFLRYCRTASAKQGVGDMSQRSCSRCPVKLFPLRSPSNSLFGFGPSILFDVPWHNRHTSTMRQFPSTVYDTRRHILCNVQNRIVAILHMLIPRSLDSRQKLHRERSCVLFHLDCTEQAVNITVEAR